jgi:hypothetical protein
MQPEFENILASDLPDIEKLTQSFQLILKEHIEHEKHEVELQKALGDQEELIKTQIKLGVYEYTNDIFAFCYLRVTGRKLSNG